MEALEDPWRSLEARAERHTVHSDWDWLILTYRLRDRLGETPLVGLAHHGDELVGAAPLVERAGSLGGVPCRRVDFAGHGEAWGEFLFAGDEAPVVQAFTESLCARVRHPVISFVISPAALPAVRDAVGPTPWRIEARPFPYIRVDLNEGFEAYFATRSQKFRRNIRSRARKVAAADGRVECVAAGHSDAELHAAADRMFAIAGRSWKLEGVGEMAQVYKDYYRDVILTFGRRGALRLYLMTLGGRDAAYFLALEDRGVLNDVAVGFDDGFRRFAPGRHLQIEVLKWMEREGIRRLVSHGMHDYKRPWMTSTPEAQLVFLTNSSLRGWLAHWMHFRVKPWMQRLRGRRGTGSEPAPEPAPEPEERA